MIHATQIFLIDSLDFVDFRKLSMAINKIKRVEQQNWGRSYHEGSGKKVFEIFFDLCTQWMYLLHTLRNPLHPTVFQNSTGNTLF